MRLEYISSVFDNIRYKHNLGEHDQRTHGNRGGSSLADETIDFFTSKFAGKDNVTVEINAVVYDKDGNIDLKKSFTVYTFAKNIERVLRDRMGELADSGNRDTYTARELIKSPMYGDSKGERFEKTVHSHLLRGDEAPPAPAPAPKRPSGEGVVAVKPMKIDEPVFLGAVTPRDKKIADKILAIDKRLSKYQKTPDKEITAKIKAGDGREMRIRTTPRQLALIQRRQDLILRYIGMGLAITNMGRKGLIKKFGQLAAFILGKNKKPKYGYRR